MDVSDIFNFCFFSGEGKRESEAPGGGGSVLIENPGGWGLREGRGAEGPRGREGVCGEFGGEGG